MPLTTIDSSAALVSIDLQKGILSIPTLHPASEIVAHTAQLAQAFRQRNLPVVLVNVTGAAPGRTDAERRTFPSGSDWAELATELDPQPTDILVTKKRWGAFLGTDLHEQLQKRGVTQIFLTGVATSVGVESTARSAYDLGYNVVLITDAMTDRTPDAHENSITKVFPRLGETTTAAEVLKHLANK